MELYFCDLCQEGVPVADLDEGQATLNGERVTCATCNLAMGTSSGETAPQKKSPRRHSGRGMTPNVAAVLAFASALLTIVSAVTLLTLARHNAQEQEKAIGRLEAQIGKVANQQRGTRTGMIEQARQAGEQAIYDELKRFDTYERQLSELRVALATPTAGVPSAETLAASSALELAASSDSVEKIATLEQQLLFLQARIFELQEEVAQGGSRVVPQEPQDNVLLPEGELGQIVAQLTHEDPIERVSALYALAVSRDTGVVRHIVPLLEDQDAYIRTLAARVLERSGARSAVQSLIKALDDGDAGVRRATVSALRGITSQQFQFDPLGPASDRFKAVKRWSAWWSENWKVFLYQGE